MKHSLVKHLVLGLAIAALAIAAQPSFGSLILHYQFETADGAVPQTTPDSSGNNLTGTMNGVATPGYPTVEAGPQPPHAGYNPANVMSFPGGNAGTSSRVEVPDASAGPLDAVFTQFSFAAWLNPGTMGSSTHYFAGKMGSSTSRGWQMNRVPNSNSLQVSYFSTASGTSANQSLTVPNFFTPGSWTHLAFVYNGVTHTADIYKDGVNVLNQTTGVPDTLNGANTTAFEIGNRGRHSDTAAYSWIGYIDDVRIYDHALSDTEVGQLVVPEPGGLILLAAGLIGLAVFRFRRK
jgi:large repetitive protein